MSDDLTPRTVPEVIASHRYRPQDHATIAGNAYCCCGWWRPIVNTRKTAIDLHADHVADVLTDTRTVLTVDELLALPVQSVVRDVDGMVFEFAPDGEGDVMWWYDGDPHEVGEVELPALVLWIPRAEEQS